MQSDARQTSRENAPRGHDCISIRIVLTTKNHSHHRRNPHSSCRSIISLRMQHSQGNAGPARVENLLSTTAPPIITLHRPRLLATTVLRRTLVALPPGTQFKETLWPARATIASLDSGGPDSPIRTAKSWREEGKCAISEHSYCIRPDRPRPRDDHNQPTTSHHPQNKKPIPPQQQNLLSIAKHDDENPRKNFIYYWRKVDARRRSYPIQGRRSLHYLES